jgi:hypothetical protein
MSEPKAYAASLKDRFPHYWICGTCAAEKGGVLPKNYSGTVAAISCDYCKDANRQPMEPSIPWVDFDWPNDPEATERARWNRD